MFFRKIEYLVSFLLIYICLLSLIPKHSVYQSLITLIIPSLIGSLVFGTMTNFIRYLIFKSNAEK